MDLKRSLTFSEQVEKLKEHSIIITDDEQKDAEEYLGQQFFTLCIPASAEMAAANIRAERSIP